MGAVETLIVYEDLDITRHVLRDSQGSNVVIHTMPPPPSASNNAAAGGSSVGIAALSDIDRAKFLDKDTGLEMEQAEEPKPLLEWLADKHTEFGAQLEFVTNKSTEGSQVSLGTVVLIPSVIY